MPYGSEGEYNIFGYLGMIGIPLNPVTEFPGEGKIAIFTRHSLKDPGLANKMLARLRNRQDICITWQLWLQLQNTEFKNTLNLIEYGGSVSSSEFRTHTDWELQMAKAEKPVTFSRIKTATQPYVRDVAVVQEDYDYGVLLRVFISTEQSIF